MTIPLEDPSRPELATTDPGDYRKLLTELWYPAAESARNAERTTFASYFGEAADTIVPLLTAYGATEEMIRAVANDPTGSVRDAAVSEDGPFPLIVFSHGNGGVRFQSLFLTEHLASHGYVVISADHTGNSIVTLVDGEIVGSGGQDGTYDVAKSAADRIPDARFLVDAAAALDAQDRRFLDRIDVERVGITGHSFGGFTTLGAMSEDDRFLAGAPLTAGGLSSGFGSNIDRPVAHFLGEEDHTVSNAAIEEQYAALAGPKMLVRVADAGHFSFSNMCLINPQNEDGCGTGTRLVTGEPFTFLDDERVFEVTNYYAAALFGLYVKLEPSYAADMEQEPFAEIVTVERVGLP